MNHWFTKKQAIALAMSLSFCFGVSTVGHAKPRTIYDGLLSEFLNLVKISSPSGQEEPVRHYVENRLNQMGLKPYYNVDTSGNILLKIPANEESKQALLISVHMDTVPPCLNIKPVVEGRGEERVIRSSGDTVLGGDNKAALASLLLALEQMVKNKLPHGNLLIFITTQEEIGGLGAAAIPVSEYQHADLAIALDSNGPQGTVVYAAPQLTIFDITMKGRSAHSGFEPEKGANALRALTLAVAQFPQGRLDSETTANVGFIQGGKKFNIVPDLAVANGEVRSLKPQRVREELENMKIKLALANDQVPGTSYTWQEKTVIEAYHTDLNQPVFEPLKQALKESELPFIPIKTNGGSDVNIFASKAGVPSIVLSGAYYNPHQVNEYVYLKDMVKLSELLTHLMQNYR